MASRELQRDSQLQMRRLAEQPSALHQLVTQPLLSHPFHGAGAICEQHGGKDMFAPVPEESPLDAEHVWPSSDGEDAVFGSLENLGVFQ